MAYNLEKSDIKHPSGMYKSKLLHIYDIYVKNTKEEVKFYAFHTATKDRFFQLLLGR